MGCLCLISGKFFHIKVIKFCRLLFSPQAWLSSVFFLLTQVACCRWSSLSGSGGACAHACTHAPPPTPWHSAPQQSALCPSHLGWQVSLLAPRPHARLLRVGRPLCFLPLGAPPMVALAAAVQASGCGPGHCRWRDNEKRPCRSGGRIYTPQQGYWDGGADTAWGASPHPAPQKAWVSAVPRAQVRDLCADAL